MTINKEDIKAFMATGFPQSGCRVDLVGDGSATVSRPIVDAGLRPGGTVSGPVMMGVADVALYVAILGKVGIVPLAVTTNLSINFLRKPSATARIVAKCELIKIGKALVVGEVALYSDGSDKMVAHAVGT